MNLVITQREIKNGQTIKIPIKRQPDSSFYFSASVNGYSDELDIPKPAKKGTVAYDVAGSGNITAWTGERNGYSDMEASECLRAKPDEIYLTSTARVVDIEWFGEDRGRVWSKLETNPPANEKQICFRIHAHVSSKMYSAKITSHVEAIRVTSK